MKSQETSKELLPRLSKKLQKSFTPLPPADEKLSPEQLHALFGDDLDLFRELAQLAYQPSE